MSKQQVKDKIGRLCESVKKSRSKNRSVNSATINIRITHLMGIGNSFFEANARALREIERGIL